MTEHIGSPVDFISIVENAWKAYDASRSIQSVHDISVKVSTNHVYKVSLEGGHFVIAKLSYFGQFEHFVEDHTIINALSNNLPYPYENFLSRALVNKDGLFVHRYNDESIDAWVIFYRPIRTLNRMPNRLDEGQIEKLAKQFAKFHRACFEVRHTLPPSSKDMLSDINHLLRTLNAPISPEPYARHFDQIREHCQTFKTNLGLLNLKELTPIPVFVDWNIGNFSVTKDLKLYSRWDYDWFRMTSRMMDFYFLSRIVSSVGDKTSFSYLVDPLMEERFIRFLRVYHEHNPFNRTEILFLKEVYRFFILHYVIHFGNYFFLNRYASRLQSEAFITYLRSVDQFRPGKLLDELKL